MDNEEFYKEKREFVRYGLKSAWRELFQRWYKAQWYFS